MATTSKGLIDDSTCAENEKENDSRSGQATQAVIQRRRRPKRRSTGVVHVDMEVKVRDAPSSHAVLMKAFLSFNQDIDPDGRQESPVDNGDDKDVVSATKDRKAKNS